MSEKYLKMSEKYLKMSEKYCLKMSEKYTMFEKYCCTCGVCKNGQSSGENPTTMCRNCTEEKSNFCSGCRAKLEPTYTLVLCTGCYEKMRKVSKIMRS